MKEKHSLSKFPFLGYFSFSKKRNNIGCDGISLADDTSLTHSLQNLIRLICYIAKPCFRNTNTPLKSLFSEFINSNSEENYSKIEDYLFQKINFDRLIQSRLMCCKILEEILYIIAQEEGVTIHQEIFRCQITPIIDSVLLFGCNFCFSTLKTHSFAKKLTYIKPNLNLQTDYLSQTNIKFNTTLGPDYLIICFNKPQYILDYYTVNKAKGLKHNNFEYLFFCFYLFIPGKKSKLVWRYKDDKFVDEFNEFVELDRLFEYKIGFIVFTKTMSEVQFSSFKIAEPTKRKN